MTDATKTPEQLAAEAQAAAAKKEADKKAAKDKKDAEKAAAKAAKDAEKAKKDAEKAEAKAKKDQEVAAKAAAKTEAAAKKEASKMPEQNGVRRPKPDGACGKVWALADELSSKLGQPVPIADLSKQASAAGINDSTIRTQYALWRKFHGITGRVVAPAPAPAAAPAAGGAAA